MIDTVASTVSAIAATIGFFLPDMNLEEAIKIKN
jgi:hypothetical protein